MLLLLFYASLAHWSLLLNLASHDCVTIIFGPIEAPRFRCQNRDWRKVPKSKIKFVTFDIFSVSDFWPKKFNCVVTTSRLFLFFHFYLHHFLHHIWAPANRLILSPTMFVLKLYLQIILDGFFKRRCIDLQYPLPYATKA